MHWLDEVNIRLKRKNQLMDCYAFAKELTCKANIALTVTLLAKKCGTCDIIVKK